MLPVGVDPYGTGSEAARPADRLGALHVRTSGEDHDQRDEQRRQQEEDDMLRRTEVDDAEGAAEIHVPRRERHLTGPFGSPFPARKLEVLRVRDVGHDDVRGTERLVFQLRRGLLRSMFSLARKRSGRERDRRADRK
jgi:hypothetical protein